jgi:hypothetical protein
MSEIYVYKWEDIRKYPLSTGSSQKERFKNERDIGKIKIFSFRTSNGITKVINYFR